MLNLRPTIETLLADVRYGCRRLWRAPAFTIVSVLTLTLGIGVTTAMVSLARPIMFDTLPYPASDRVMVIWDRAMRADRVEVTFGTFVEIEARTHAFQSLAVSPFGGIVAIIQTSFAAAPQSVPLTDAMAEALREVQPGTPVTFFAYVRSSTSGAMTPYTCVEF